MTPEELNAIEQRVNAASPNDWTSHSLECERLTRQIPALIKEIKRLREAVKQFVEHYPHGVNPYLDVAFGTALDALKGGGE